MNRLAFFFLVFSFVFDLAAQQDTLWLTDGRCYVVDTVVINQDSSFSVKIIKNEGCLKDKDFEYDEVFSLNKSDGSRKIFYVPGSDDLTMEQMDLFVKGENFARKNYKPVVVSVANYLISTGISLFFGMHGAVFYAPLAVMIPAVVLSNIKPTLKISGLNKDSMYSKGYLVAARHKRTLYLIKAGVAGLITGGGISFLIVK